MPLEAMALQSRSSHDLWCAQAKNRFQITWIRRRWLLSLKCGSFVSSCDCKANENATKSRMMQQSDRQKEKRISVTGTQGTHKSQVIRRVCYAICLFDLLPSLATVWKTLAKMQAACYHPFSYIAAEQLCVYLTFAISPAILFYRW